MEKLTGVEFGGALSGLQLPDKAFRCSTTIVLYELYSCSKLSIWSPLLIILHEQAEQHQEYNFEEKQEPWKQILLQLRHDCYKHDRNTSELPGAANIDDCGMPYLGLDMQTWLVSPHFGNKLKWHVVLSKNIHDDHTQLAASGNGR